MSSPVNHHSVPQFYLSRWTSEKDKKLWEVRNFNGAISRERRTTKQTGFKPHLYSYSEDYPVKERAEIEIKFFSKLDNEGAKIVAKFLADEDLNKKEKIIWAQFLAGMRVRTPESVQKIKAHATDYVTKELGLGNAEYKALKQKEYPESFIQWVAQQRPGLTENIGVSQIPKIASNPQALTDILRMAWQSFSIENTAHLLLSSDRPCIFTAGLQNEDCIIALPLSPKCAFFAFYPGSKAQTHLMSTPVNTLVAALNRNVIAQAKERAYCHNASDAPDSFFKKYLVRSG
jgi:hypothetical protein